MSYRTINELDNFKFIETHVNDIEYAGGRFSIILDNVVICSQNSCNRDIRDMRTNDLRLNIDAANIISFVEEGYKVYDPDGKLIQDDEDVEIDVGKYIEYFKLMRDSWLYEIVKTEKENIIEYQFIIDANEHTYAITVCGERDVEEWERFMNLQ